MIAWPGLSILARRSWRLKLFAVLALTCLLLLVFINGHDAPGTARAAAPSRLPPTPTTRTPPAFRFPAYFTEWGVYQRDYVPADIPADLITDIDYAFINPTDTDGNGLYECAIYDTWASEQKPMQRLVPGTDTTRGENLGNLNQMRVLRRNYPGLSVLMSIGGWTLSGNFHTIASTPTQRQHFAHECAAFMDARGFDGIDIDWEYPTAADRDNFTALLQTLRQELDILGSHNGRSYPLTIAAPAGPANIANIDVARIAPSLTWADIMTYDFNGGWDNVTGHNSPLCGAGSDPHDPRWNSNGAIQQYLSGGLPANKVLLGMPYYGRAFQHLQNAGPQPTPYPGRFAPVTPGDYVQGTWEYTGVFDYWDIAERFTGPGSILASAGACTSIGARPFPGSIPPRRPSWRSSPTAS